MLNPNFNAFAQVNVGTIAEITCTTNAKAYTVAGTPAYVTGAGSIVLGTNGFKWNEPATMTCHVIATLEFSSDTAALACSFALVKAGGYVSGTTALATAAQSRVITVTSDLEPSTYQVVIDAFLPLAQGDEIEVACASGTDGKKIDVGSITFTVQSLDERVELP